MSYVVQVVEKATGAVVERSEEMGQRRAYREAGKLAWKRDPALFLVQMVEVDRQHSDIRSQA
jgi:hypothetical protein